MTADLDSWGQNWSRMEWTVKSHNSDIILRFFNVVTLGYLLFKLLLLVVTSGTKIEFKIRLATNVKLNDGLDE